MNTSSTDNKADGPFKLAGLWLYAGVIAAGFLLIGLVSWYIRDANDSSAAESDAVVQARLKTLREMREQDQKLLTTYGWVDKQAGIVRIPVDRAMELELWELQKKPVGKCAAVVAAPAPAQTEAQAPAKK